MNFPYLLDVQARHAAWVIAWALKNDAIEIEASAEAETAWVETVVARSSASAGRAKSCTPGYYNREGQANAKTRQGSFFFGTPTEYADILEASRAAAHRRDSRFDGCTMSSRRYLAGRVLALTRRRHSPRVVIIGAGFGGLAAAVALRRKGIDDLLIIERADGVGGTWRQNVYPGAACDIQSHLYSFSFAPNRAWSRTYAYQPEILAYLETVADDFDLRRHLMLGTSVRRIGLERGSAALGCRAGSERRHADRRGRRRQRCRIVRRREISRHRRACRLLRRSDAHRAVGYHRRPDRQAGGGGRHGCQRRAGGTRNRRHHSAIDGLPAHAAMDGAQGGPPLQRRGVARFRRHPWASLRERWRLWKLQHDNTALTPDHPRLAVVQEAVGEVSARARRGRRAAGCVDTPLSVPMQAGAARRKVLRRIATPPRRPGD